MQRLNNLPQGQKKEDLSIAIKGLLEAYTDDTELVIDTIIVDNFRKLSRLGDNITGSKYDVTLRIVL